MGYPVIPAEPDAAAALPSASPIRVLIVEDHFALADSLELAIGLQPDMECVGLAGTVSQALELVAGCSPDVVLMDVRLPDGNGIEATARIKAIRPGTSVLILTALPDPLLMARAAEARASGFLRKAARVSEILRSIRLAAAGGLTLDPSTLRALVNVSAGNGGPPSGGRFSNLTSRESEVLACMVAGLAPKAIAAQLGITVSTCRGYVKAILQKLGAHSQLEAVAVAAREGLIADTTA
jgi:DNA-binding NarL/FixJ family response regulator